MNQFLVHTLPGSVLVVDTSEVGPNARTVPSHFFNSWKEAERHFLSLGAPQEALDSVADAVKETRTAKLAF
jgi:hypothetical protein